jgi:hypothetical protein
VHGVQRCVRVSDTEIKALNARASAVKVDDMLAKIAADDNKLAEEDEMVLLETFEGKTKRLLHAEDDVNVDALFTRRKRKNPEPAEGNNNVAPLLPGFAVPAVPAAPAAKPAAAAAPVAVEVKKAPIKLVHY